MEHVKIVLHDSLLDSLGGELSEQRSYKSFLVAGSKMGKFTPTSGRSACQSIPTGR